MNRTRSPAPLILLIMPMLLTIAGCSNDDRLLELSRESLRQQAEQNEQMARQSQEVTEASRELVAADAEARREMIEVHQDIQSERQSLDRQHEHLESERRQIAAHRHRDPVIANAVLTTGLILAGLLPLVVAWLLLKNLFSQSDDAPLAEVLIAEMAAAEPILLAPVTERLPRLPADRPGAVPRIGAEAVRPSPVLIVVEGRHDISFLKRISRVLHADDEQVPDLEEWEQQQRILFVPAGGDNIADWTTRLSAISQREVHIYDREGPEHARQRQMLVETVNARPGCRAFLIQKRSLESYLHPDAIFEALRVRVSFDDDECVATLVARAQLDLKEPEAWERISARGRKRLRALAKHSLNSTAVERMTVSRLAERDPAGEVRSWLNAITELASAPREQQT